MEFSSIDGYIDQRMLRTSTKSGLDEVSSRVGTFLAWLLLGVGYFELFTSSLFSR